MRFSRSFCLLLTEFFLSIRTEISVCSLPLCQILQVFTVNFQRYFWSKCKFCKIFEGTRSVNLHLGRPGVLAWARAMSGPRRARQETISSHLNTFFNSELTSKRKLSWLISTRVGKYLTQFWNLLNHWVCCFQNCLKYIEPYSKHHTSLVAWSGWRGARTRLTLFCLGGGGELLMPVPTLRWS